MKINYRFLLLIIVIASCNTEDNGEEQIPPISAKDCRINSVTYSEEIFFYQYEDNKVVSLTSPERKVIVNYNNQDKIKGYEIRNAENEQIQFKKEFEYNGNGLLIEERNYDRYMGNLIPTSRFEYEYDDSRLIKVINYDMDSDAFEGKTLYSWENGNIVSSSFYDVNNELECTTEFTFETSIDNQFKNDFTDFYFLELYDSDYDEVIFFSDNLIKSSTNLCGNETKLWDIIINERGFIEQANFDNSTYWKITYDCN